MEFLNNITQGRGKVITSALATALSALILLTTIHIAIKIACIIFAVTVTYLALSLIHKIRAGKNDAAKVKQKPEDDIDAGYGTEDETEEGNVISAEEREEIEAELEAEIIRAKAEEEMKNGLPEHIVLAVQVSNEQSASQNDKSQTQYKSDYMSLMQSPPEHMDALGNSLPEKPNTNISMEAPVELSPAGWLSFHYGIRS